jgi:acyl-CoA thioester hydrolase
MTIDAPLQLHRDRVRPEWIDYNGHMNLAYYVLAFDYATDALFDFLGCGAAYKEATDFSTFTLEGHVTYDREVLEGEPLLFKTWLLDYDAKRIHYFHEMWHAEAGYLASTNELISIHIDMAARRSAPFPETILGRLEAVMQEHRKLERPANVGRVIGIRPRRPAEARSA